MARGWCYLSGKQCLPPQVSSVFHILKLQHYQLGKSRVPILASQHAPTLQSVIFGSTSVRETTQPWVTLLSKGFASLFSLLPLQLA